MAFTKYPKSDFMPGKLLYGQGAFGNVITGKLKGKFIVVKMLHCPVAEDRMTIFNSMGNLKHRNLIQFMGIIDQDPCDCPQLVFKHANKGNLLEWLRENKGQPNQKTMIKFTSDIINGMEYLHKVEFVHGCLAARNILLDEFQDIQNPGNKIYLNAQISDYGMTRIVEGTGANYYKVNSASVKTLPLRWMPMEAIINNDDDGQVTYSSDVWSFGVVLWEMWTRGDIPYGMTASNKEVRQNILDGQSPLTFHKPVTCPEDILAIMCNIFKTARSPDDRPTFLDLQKSFHSSHGRKFPPQTRKEETRPQITTYESNAYRRKIELIHPSESGQGDVSYKRDQPARKKTCHCKEPQNGHTSWRCSSYPNTQTNFESDLSWRPSTSTTSIHPTINRSSNDRGSMANDFFTRERQLPTGPPPPYTAVSGAESNANLEQTIRELKNKIDSMKMSEQINQLQQEIEELRQHNQNPEGRGRGKSSYNSGMFTRGKGPRGRGRGRQ